MEDIRIPIGLCDVTYDGVTHTNLADEAMFEAKPTYQTLKGGQFNKHYILEDYRVSFELYLSEESYDTLKLANPSLKEYNGGLYDNPSNVNQNGKQLVIHPSEAGESKDYDITIFSAIIDPKQPYSKTYKKGLDMVKVRFLGQPDKNINGNEFKSYYFIGDTVEAGVN